MLTRPRYASAKQYLVQSARRRDDIATHVLASFAAGTVATTLCAPADVLKSRMQSSAGKDVSSTSLRLARRSRIPANLPQGLFQVIRTGLREEGPRFLMKGWTPAWLRLTCVSPPPPLLTCAFADAFQAAHCPHLCLHGAAAESHANTALFSGEGDLQAVAVAVAG